MARKDGRVPKRVVLTEHERVTLCTALRLEAARGRARADQLPLRADELRSQADYEEALAEWLVGGPRPTPRGHHAS